MCLPPQIFILMVALLVVSVFVPGGSRRSRRSRDGSLAGALRTELEKMAVDKKVSLCTHSLLAIMTIVSQV